MFIVHTFWFCEVSRWREVCICVFGVFMSWQILLPLFLNFQGCCGSLTRFWRLWDSCLGCSCFGERTKPHLLRQLLRCKGSTCCVARTIWTCRSTQQPQIDLCLRFWAFLYLLMFVEISEDYTWDLDWCSKSMAESCRSGRPIEVWTSAISFPTQDKWCCPSLAARSICGSMCACASAGDVFPWETQEGPGPVGQGTSGTSTDKDAKTVWCFETLQLPETKALDGNGIYIWSHVKSCECFQSFVERVFAELCRVWTNQKAPILSCSARWCRRWMLCSATSWTQRVSWTFKFCTSGVCTTSASMLENGARTCESHRWWAMMGIYAG